MTTAPSSQGFHQSQPKPLEPEAFGLVILSLGLLLHLLWRWLVRPYLAGVAVILHESSADWSSMVGYVLILVGGVVSGFFFLDYYRAHDQSAGRGIFIGTIFLVGFLTGLYLFDWGIFSFYAQLAPLYGGKFVLYLEFVADEVLAPSLLGVLFVLWGGSLIRFTLHRQRESPEIQRAQIAGGLFLAAAVLSFLMPIVTLAIDASLAADDVFRVWLLIEGVFSP